MKVQGFLYPTFCSACQSWHGFAASIHMHENHYKKRAGVAGSRERASGSVG